MNANQPIEDKKFFEHYGRLAFQRDLLVEENASVRKQLVEILEENANLKKNNQDSDKNKKAVKS